MTERMDVRWERLDERFASIGGDRRLERIFANGRWLEGPAYSPRWRCLLFSDIPNDRTLRWDETSGVVRRLLPAVRLRERPHDRPAGPRHHVRARRSPGHAARARRLDDRPRRRAGGASGSTARTTSSSAPTARSGSPTRATGSTRTTRAIVPRARSAAATSSGSTRTARSRSSPTTSCGRTGSRSPRDESQLYVVDTSGPPHPAVRRVRAGRADRRGGVRGRRRFGVRRGSSRRGGASLGRGRGRHPLLRPGRDAAREAPPAGDRVQSHVRRHRSATSCSSRRPGPSTCCA